MEKLVKIIVFVPIQHAGQIRQVLSDAGAGHVGNYDFCSFSSVGIGRFRPLTGSHPHIGTPGQITNVDEERIETICPESIVKDVLAKVIAAHPYEEPAIDVYPLLSV